MTKYSLHLVNSGTLCDPVHKLRFRLNQDFWASPKETYHTHQILLLHSLLCGSFWWTLWIFDLLSRGIKKVNSLTVFAQCNWSTLIPAYSCCAGGQLFWNWLFAARKECWKGKGTFFGGICSGSLISEFGGDRRVSLIHTLHCTDEDARAKRGRPTVIQGGSGGAGIHPGVFSPCPALFAGICRHRPLLQIPHVHAETEFCNL